MFKQLALRRRVRMHLTPQHREILTTIGTTGASADELRRHGREFGELSAAHLIVFWSQGHPRPERVHGPAAVAGRWYLTTSGASAIDLDPPLLRLA